MTFTASRQRNTSSFSSTPSAANPVTNSSTSSHTRIAPISPHYHLHNPTRLQTSSNINQRQSRQQQMTTFTMGPNFNVTSSVMKQSRQQQQQQQQHQQQQQQQNPQQSQQQQQNQYFQLQQPQLKRSLILFVICFSFLLFLFSQISPISLQSSQSSTSSSSSSFNQDGDDDAMRYSQAASHFRKHLTQQQLDAYYSRKEAALRNMYPQITDEKKALLFASNVSSPYFNACYLNPDTSTLHSSLRRGPDEVEIEGRERAKQPRDFDDIFSTIDNRRYLFNADRTAVQTIDYLGAGLDTDFDDAIEIAKVVFKHDLQVDSISDIDIPTGYIRTTRQDGWQAVVNMFATGSKNTTRVNARRMITVTRGYGKPCETSLVRPREMVRINVVIPYSNRPHRIYIFMKMFAAYFASLSPSYDLMKIIISTTKEEELSTMKMVKKFTEFSTNELYHKRIQIVVSKGDEFGKFSRAVAIRDGVKSVPSDEVLFIADTDLKIAGNFLQNCRVNIIRGSQVFFPIMFSLFPYGKGLSSRDGMWRRSSYGMVCMYKSDFDSVGGFGPQEETRFSGWGSEDVFLYNRFRDNEKYSILRALEPGLQHQWHGKDCERNEHYVDCMRTVYMTIGSQDAIAKLMVDAQVDVTNLTKNALPV